MPANSSLYDATSHTNQTIGGSQGECFTVAKNGPRISTQVKNAGADGAVGGTGVNADTNIADNANVASGTKVFDTATVTGAASPAQTVSYFYAGPFSTPFASTDCATGTAIVLVRTHQL